MLIWKEAASNVLYQLLLLFLLLTASLIVVSQRSLVFYSIPK